MGSRGIITFGSVRNIPHWILSYLPCLSPSNHTTLYQCLFQLIVDLLELSSCTVYLSANEHSILQMKVLSTSHASTIMSINNLALETICILLLKP